MRCLFGGGGGCRMGFFGLAEGGFEAIAGDEEDEEGHGGDDDRDVIGLAEHGDKVGHEVERGDQVGDKDDEDDPGRAADGAVAEKGTASADAAGGREGEEAAATVRAAQAEVRTCGNERQENEDGDHPGVPGHGAMLALRERVRAGCCGGGPVAATIGGLLGGPNS